MLPFPTVVGGGGFMSSMIMAKSSTCPSFPAIQWAHCPSFQYLLLRIIVREVDECWNQEHRQRSADLFVVYIDIFVRYAPKRWSSNRSQINFVRFISRTAFDRTGTRRWEMMNAKRNSLRPGMWCRGVLHNRGGIRKIVTSAQRVLGV